MAVKVDVTQVLTRFDGEAIQVEGKPMTVRLVLTNAMLNTDRKEQLSGTEQWERYAMAKRINERDVIEFTAQEAADLQERVAKFYAPLVTGQVWEIIEGKGGADGEPADES